MIQNGDWLVDQDERLLGQVFASTRSGKVWVARRMKRSRPTQKLRMVESLIDPATASVKNPRYAVETLLEVAASIHEEDTWRILRPTEIEKWVRVRCLDQRYNDQTCSWEYYMGEPHPLPGYCDEIYVRPLGDLPSLSSDSRSGREPMLGTGPDTLPL